jgi:chitodextrinase
MRRVVLFRKKAEADPAVFEAAIGGLVVLDQKMTEMTTWWVSVNQGAEGMWDAALVADFVDVEALRRYEQHPSHVEAATAVGEVSEFAVFDSK